MKRFLLWSFERGSTQYDLICLVILAFIFLAPPSVFNDRPDFMRVSSDQVVRKTSDDDGRTVFTVKVETTVFSRQRVTEEDAIERLKAWLGAPIVVSHARPVYDTTGALVAYSIWVERNSRE